MKTLVRSGLIELTFSTSKRTTIMTQGGHTYLVVIDHDGLERFATSNELPFGDYDSKSRLKVVGVDMI